MDTRESEKGWCILGKTVRGASHVRSEMPNQDAINWHPKSDKTTLPIIMVVSDGHGGAKYFRSKDGASLAVNTATTIIHNFLLGQSGVNNLSIIKESAEDWLPKTLVRRWLEAVDDHIKSNPITTEELGILESKHGVEIRRFAEKNPIAAYGATLLIVVITEGFLLFMQLGDGDILAISDQGEVFRPLPADARLFGNETTSLCSPNAWRDFRINFRPITGEPLALLLLSTDGYANCFKDEEGFNKVGIDIYKMIRTDGIDYINNNLESWLIDASETGSGDDITVGLICNLKFLVKDNSTQKVSTEEPEEAPLIGELVSTASSPIEKNIEIANSLSIPEGENHL